MVRHIVLFKLKEPTPENLRLCAEKFYSMRGKVPGLLELEAGFDFLHSERSYDLALNTVFDSRESFEAYQTHPAHMPVKVHMAQVREACVAVDYDI